jgi:hypothetical protein
MYISVFQLSASELQWISPVVSKAVAFMIEYGPSQLSLLGQRLMITQTQKISQIITDGYQ